MSSRNKVHHNLWMLFSGVVLCALLPVLTGCEDETVKRDYPRVRTLEVTNVTKDGVTFIAEVYDEGNTGITEHGFTWALSTPDMNSDERVCLGSFSGTGRFEAEITTTLAEGLIYEVCAFVKAGDYTVYGEKIKFTSLGSGAPEITGFVPHAAGWGDTVTVKGRKFSHLNITNKIYIDECVCWPFYASDTLLKFVLPVEVTKLQNSLSINMLGNVAMAGEKLTLINPECYGFTPAMGHWGDTVTITGHHLSFIGLRPSDGMLFNGSATAKAVRSGAGSVSFLIPGAIRTVSSTVSVSYGPFSFSFPQSLTLLPPETDSFNPVEGTWGTTVRMYGRFNPVKEQSRFMFGGKQAQIISVSPDSAIVKVPEDLGEYSTTVTYQSEPFTSQFPGNFTLKRPEIITFSPAEGYVGQTIKIRGRFFKKDATTVNIGGSPAWVRSVNDTVITCYVPGDVHGECDVTVSLMGYTAVAPVKFNATNHVITGITPLIPAFGETVTVSGTNFRSGTIIYLGPYQVATESQTENEIKFIVPLWLPYLPGKLTAKYSYWDSDHWSESSFSYGDQFEVKDFTVTNVTPVSGVAGEVLTISGSDFGSPEVAFGSVPGEVIEATTSVITVRVPPLSSGEHTVNVTVGGRTHACPVKYTHSGAWHRLSDLPFLYDYGCAFDFGEEAYVITGGETDVYDKEIYRFNPANKGFTRIAGTFRTGILNPISCTLGGKGYMIGQKSDDFFGVGFEVFNPDSATLRKLPDYPGNQTVNPVIIADDSVIYAGCGLMAYTSYHYWYSDFWKYSPATNRWTRLADCPYYVSFSNQVFIDGRLIFLGHLGLFYQLEYHPMTNTWSQTEMNEAELGYWLLLGFKYGARVSVVNDGKWYVGFGDWYQNNEDYGTTDPGINNRFYSFDPYDNSWKTIANVAAPPRTFALAFSIGGKIYIGGHQIYRWYDFWEYDPAIDN